jgi:hypothetical protein
MVRDVMVRPLGMGGVRGRCLRGDGYERSNRNDRHRRDKTPEHRFLHVVFDVTSAGHFDLFEIPFARTALAGEKMGSKSKLRKHNMQICHALLNI